VCPTTPTLFLHFRPVVLKPQTCAHPEPTAHTHAPLRNCQDDEDDVGPEDDGGWSHGGSGSGGGPRMTRSEAGRARAAREDLAADHREEMQQYQASSTLRVPPLHLRACPFHVMRVCKQY
jgi:hypothetical protein